MNIQALADFLDSVKDEIRPMIDIIDCTNWCVTDQDIVLAQVKEDLYEWEIDEGEVGEGEFTILNVDMHSKYGGTIVLHNACRLPEDDFNEKYQ